MKKLLFAVCLFGACQFGCIEKVIIGDNGQLPSCETSTSPCELPGEPNGLPTSGCDSVVKVTVIGPGEGQIAAGAKGALFARVSVINACGPSTFKSLSVYLASEQLTKYCAATCTATDAWNFSRPILVSGGTVFAAANGFHLAQMHDGTPALEATFD